ncbi:hypothetical protein DRN98_08815, partial [Methanosarcinales archaeon]
MRKEPTKTKTLIISFERTMNNLINNFKKKAFPRIQFVVSQNRLELELNKIQNASLVDDINRILDETEYSEITTKLRPVVRRYTGQAYTKGAKKGIADLNRLNFEVAFYMSRRDIEAVSVMIEHNLAELKNASSYMKKEILRVVSTGMLEGQSMQKMAEAMTERINVTKKRASMIVRTETIRNYNQAAANKYKENGIRKWRWVAALGERTCEICAGLDGQVFSFGDPQPPSPHPNCFDKDTEVLTDDGWKYFKDLKNEKILSVNLETGNSEWVSIKSKISYYLDGNMIHYFNRIMD